MIHLSSHGDTTTVCGLQREMWSWTKELVTCPKCLGQDTLTWSQVSARLTAWGVESGAAEKPTKGSTSIVVLPNVLAMLNGFSYVTITYASRGHYAVAQH